jgi:hypothetical protein
MMPQQKTKTLPSDDMPIFQKKTDKLLFWQGVLFSFGLGSLLVEALIFLQSQFPILENYIFRVLVFVLMIIGFSMTSIWDSQEKSVFISKKHRVLGMLLLALLLLVYEFFRFSVMLKAKYWPLSPLFITVHLIANIFFISLPLWSSHKSRKSHVT